MFFEKFNPLNENFDPLLTLTEAINAQIENSPLQTIVDKVNEGTMNLYNNVQIISQEKPIIPEQVKVVSETENKKELSPIENMLKKLYIGCFSDDPTNPSLEDYLGNVSSPIEAIKLAKDKGYKYVGIQQGGKCFASNKIPSDVSDDNICSYKYFNLKNCEGADWYYSTCGGYYYNKVFSTDIELDDELINKLCVSNNINQQEVAVEKIEEFNNLGKEIDIINLNVNHNNLSVKEPLNSYYLLLWLIVILFIIYLIIEYINKPNKNIEV